MYARTRLARDKAITTGPVLLQAASSRSCTLDDCAAKSCPVLHGLGSLRYYDLNETLFWENDAAASYFLIESGVVRAYRMLDDGRRQICQFVFPGDLVAQAFHGNYSFTAEAVTQVSARVIPRTELDRALARSPCLRILFQQSLEEELHHVQDQLLVVGRMCAVERVAHFLRLLSSYTNANPVTLPMTRVDIADYLGLTLETVSRAISQLKREGKIELINANEILISSPQRLSVALNNAA